MKYGQLKAHTNNGVQILLYKPITKDYTLAVFHIDRCNMIEQLKNDYTYTKFETNLIEEI